MILLEQDGDLPSTHILKHLISEPIKSYRSTTEFKKHNNKSSHDIENDSPFIGNIAVETNTENDSVGTKCVLNPGLTTKPPIPRKCELKSQNRTPPKENNMLDDNEIEIIRLKTQKFEEDFGNKYRKNDLANETIFNSHEIMSEREFNSFLDKTQSEMKKSAADEFIKNYANFKTIELSVKEDEDMNPRNRLYATAGDRAPSIEMTSTDILTSKSDNEILLSKTDNWLLEDDYAANKVSKSEQRTDTLLKNFRNQHAEIEKCIDKAQNTLEKTKICSNSKSKNCEQQNTPVEEYDNVDLKFNKFFQHSHSSEKPPKSVLKGNNSKCSDVKALNKSDIVNTKKDKLNNMNEAKRNRLKFAENSAEYEEEESWMSKFPCEDKEYYNEVKKDAELPNFATISVHVVTDNNSKVNKWLEDDRVLVNNGKNSNFMEILENVEDLDVVTRVIDQEILDAHEHGNENKTEVSETNTYDDIVHILEVLEEEDRKSRKYSYVLILFLIDKFYENNHNPILSQ